MKSLSESQLKLARYPNKRGKKENPADNYANIYNRVRDELRDISTIAKILPDIENHIEKYTMAKQICEFYTIEKLKPLLESLFPLGKLQGAPLDDSIFFDTSKMNGERIKLASYMLKFSSNYLMMAFRSGQYEYLHQRIEGLVKELETMKQDFEKTKKMQEIIDSYRDHVENYEPKVLMPDYYNFTAECLGCRVVGLGLTKEESIRRIEHLSKCKFIVDSLNEELKLKKWFRILWPTSKINS